jgi:xanthine phosphoribosyltransferase
VKELEARIRREGRDLGNGILKVDTFINHQVDPSFTIAAGKELARRFRAHDITKVVTAEVSGIAPAFSTGLALGVPVVWARKSKPITMPEVVYRETAPSHTKGKTVELFISPEMLGSRDSALIIDDFLASGQTIAALVRLVDQSGARLVGIGAVIEKLFEGGRELLAPLGVPIEALATITEMADGRIRFSGQGEYHEFEQSP